MATPEYADLEIGLRRRDAESYTADFRFKRPGSDVDIDKTAVVRFDLAGLQREAYDSVAYGKVLAGSLFADQAATDAFSNARNSAQQNHLQLRVRLFISVGALELHNFRWETMHDPKADHDEPLLTGENLLFSRYLSSVDWRPVRKVRKSDLRALVAISNPANLNDFQIEGRRLAALDVEGEQERAKTSLGDIRITMLASAGEATLEKLFTHLRDGYGIVYLVCHGALIKGETRLWLEDSAGKAIGVPGSELVTRMKELYDRPGLVVLASCQSAGIGSDWTSKDEGALAALGPRLAEAGIPAVLAMQGNVSMRTVAEFMPIFFRELGRDGQIDRAVAVARGAVRSRPDFWAPVLFMRSQSGLIWYVPGRTPGAEEQKFERWEDVLNEITEGTCTPVVGPGILDSLIGSPLEVARRWAEQYQFPMAPHNRENLPQVAQYLTVREGPKFPHREIRKYLHHEILRRYRDILPEELRGASREELNRLIDAVAAERWKKDPLEAHRLLARLPFKVYITTNADNLLASALKEVGKDPQVELCRWKKGMPQSSSVYDTEPKYRPDTDRPLVFHLFGRNEDPASLVLTEDDYFDFLIGASRNMDVIPNVVRSSFVNSALLFLGFQIDDWNFRVLFRSIMSQEGAPSFGLHKHVAVQVDPEEGRILDTERARKYLDGYFENAKMSIYWGRAEDFVSELWRRHDQETSAKRAV